MYVHMALSSLWSIGIPHHCRWHCIAIILVHPSPLSFIYQLFLYPTLYQILITMKLSCQSFVPFSRTILLLLFKSLLLFIHLYCTSLSCTNQIHTISYSITNSIYFTPMPSISARGNGECMHWPGLVRVLDPFHLCAPALPIDGGE
jgi:hypothetical protein